MLKSVLEKLRKFILSYSCLKDESLVVPLSLWIAATYVFETFDAFPYLVITAKIKRAGKTRLKELIGFTCQMPFSVTGASAAALFRSIKDNKPTILWDEAEELSKEGNSLMRQFLNSGYRKGQTIPRASGEGVIEWPTYCPKAFVLIGDVFDTLRDRSIVVEMDRMTPEQAQGMKRFSYETAKAEGAEIAEELKSVLAENLESINEAYNSEELSFLTDRDEEIWRPIFAIAKVLDTATYNAKTTNKTRSMRALAVDLATEKTSTERYKPSAEAEAKLEQEEYGLKLLHDMLSIMPKGMKCISSVEALSRLRKIDVAPWRKYHGEGLTLNNSAEPNSMSALLSPYNVQAKPVRDGKKVSRGFLRADIERAIKETKGGK
jgi:hypothetical protein